MNEVNFYFFESYFLVESEEIVRISYKLLSLLAVSKKIASLFSCPFYPLQMSLHSECKEVD